VQQHPGRGGDRADAPGTDTDPTRRLEARLEKGLPRSAGPRVAARSRLTVRWSPVSRRPTRCLIGVVSVGARPRSPGRPGRREGGVRVVGPFVQQPQDLGVGAPRGGVVLTAGPRVRGPDPPAVRSGDDLHVAAVGRVLTGPPQVHPRRGGSSRRQATGCLTGAAAVCVRTVSPLGHIIAPVSLQVRSPGSSAVGAPEELQALHSPSG
jgi:hypothetical protein